MTLDERKAKLVSTILNTEEDDLVRILEEDVVAYKTQHEEVNEDGLTQEEVGELRQLAEDDNPDNYVTHEEFMKEMNSWLRR